MNANKLDYEANSIDTSRRRFLEICLAGTGVAICPSVLRAATPSRSLKWGSASLGSTGYVIIEALAQVVQRHTNISCTTLSTSGGAENLALIGRGKIDLGQTTSVGWLAASKGIKPFHNPIDARQIFSYTLWNQPMIVRSDSDIKSYEDIAGKRVMPSTAGGATSILYHTLLEAAGVADKVDWTYGSWNDTYSAFKSGAVDVIPATLTNGRPSPSLAQVDAATSFRVLPVSNDLIDEANKINSGVLPSTVSHEQWGKAKGQMLMPAISGVLAATPEVTDNEAYQICKAILGNSKEVRGIGAQLQDVGLNFAAEHLLENYPVNAGAVKYFREKGVWRKSLTVADPVNG